MKKFFWGFFFVFLNFNLNFNQYSLNILPDFAGYILLFQGMRELGEESRWFQSIRPFAAGMAVYTAILWLGDLLGVGSGSEYQQILTDILGLLAAIVALYVSWGLAQGVLDMEDRRGADLNGQRIDKMWKALAAVQIVNTVVGWMANLANIAALAVLAVPLVIVGLVVIVLYLTAWWKAAGAWELLLRREDGGQEDSFPDM